MKDETLPYFINQPFSIDFLAICNIIKQNLKEVFVIDFMFSDNELICMARQGNDSAEDELAKRYSKLVRICARPYFLVGGDSEDLIQEGMLGLLSAIRKYDCSANASFKTYAEQCIHNRIISAIESAARRKHIPLNDGISLDDLDNHYVSNDSFFCRQPEEQILAKEQQSEINSKREVLLSRLEKQVLAMYLEGLSYKEIADKLNKSEKSVDNAIQRIRKKFTPKN